MKNLGKTGYARLVYGELKRKIQMQPEANDSSFENLRAVAKRVQAIKMLGTLGLANMEMLPHYLVTFEDPYVIVRSVACETAKVLQISSFNSMRCSKNFKLDDRKCVFKTVLNKLLDLLAKEASLAVRSSTLEGFFDVFFITCLSDSDAEID
ncbi:hypothetical protein Ciccas_004043 [Cichlidogyrus casuarinus]|uniref:Uncharacterized protein n=1 Tax=Cichlidogyrus casuarinus TaxID=1844966 RepID=A0ABD2QCP2_9PLAT